MQLLWSLINISLAIFLLFRLLKSARIIKERIGTITAVLFVIGLFSFAGNISKEPESNNQFFWKEPTANQRFGHSKPANITLEHNLLTDYNLLISYTITDSSRQLQSYNAYSSQTGLLIGTFWRPNQFAINMISTNQLSYTLQGTVVWKLLGIPLYYQSKQYTGVLTW